MKMTFEVCSKCGKHGRISLGDSINFLNVGCKDLARRLVLSATVYAQVSDEEAGEMVQIIQSSTLPSVKDATDEMLWNIELANGHHSFPKPEEVCSLFNTTYCAEVIPVPSDFREVIERKLREGN